MLLVLLVLCTRSLDGKINKELPMIKDRVENHRVMILVLVSSYYYSWIE